jgi:Trk K+ transport system NAD-binding subunit
MVAIIAISTMVLSSYMITYNNNLFRFFKKSLTIFELRSKKTISKNKQALSDHIIMFGCGRMGEQVLNQVIEFKDDYIIIDNNSKRIEELTERGVKCMFGDVEDEGLLEELSVENAELIISTLPNIQNNYYLMSHLGSMNEGEKPFTIIAVDTGREGLELTKKGVDYVILKPHLGASQIHNLTKEIYQLKELEEDAKENSKTIEANAGEDEIAEFIHDLNKNNLKKIKSRIRRKEIRLKKIK